ncbi:MAG: sigma-54 dependent transcriptional regulator [Polyangiales bacterium]
MLSILLVEDDPDAADTLRRFLQGEGHSAAVARTAEDAQAQLRREVFDVALVDLDLPGMSGLELIETLRDEAPPMIVVTGNRDLATAVQAMRAGAADYVTKPLTLRTLQMVLRRAVETARLRQRVDRLERDALDAVGDPDPWATAVSPAMRDTLTLVERVALGGQTSVLFVGESGAGKEVLAAHLHRRSPRRGPFVRINVAAIPDSMMEAELFGATRGAYTDARRDRRGHFASADGGTLLLDEIAEMRPELQVKLLRAIETHRYYPVGASRESYADVRIVAATNREPQQAVAEGRLRADLYFRLSAMIVQVPPLRERVEDIPLLARHLLATTRKQLRRGPGDFNPEALQALAAATWPGNVRELRNVVERLAILCDGATVTRAELARCALLPGSLRTADGSGAAPALRLGPDGAPLPLDVVARDAQDRAERAHISAVLALCDGNRSRAAELLGVSRSTLWLKLQRHGLA